MEKTQTQVLPSRSSKPMWETHMSRHDRHFRKLPMAAGDKLAGRRDRRKQL
jgi:hypothetical protein